MKKKYALEMGNLLRRYTCPSDGCWVPKKGSDGVYKYVGTAHGSKLAHRMSYEFHKGPIPDKFVVDHTCRTRGCINPDHLEAVTQADNNRAMWKRIHAGDTTSKGKNINFKFWTLKMKEEWKEIAKEHFGGDLTLAINTVLELQMPDDWRDQLEKKLNAPGGVAGPKAAPSAGRAERSERRNTRPGAKRKVAPKKS